MPFGFKVRDVATGQLPDDRKAALRGFIWTSRGRFHGLHHWGHRLALADLGSRSIRRSTTRSRDDRHHRLTQGGMQNPPTRRLAAILRRRQAITRPRLRADIRLSLPFVRVRLCAQATNGGFWIRVAAYLIDWVIGGVIGFTLGFVIGIMAVITHPRSTVAATELETGDDGARGVDQHGVTCGSGSWGTDWEEGAAAGLGVDFWARETRVCMHPRHSAVSQPRGSRHRGVRTSRCSGPSRAPLSGSACSGSEWSTPTAASPSAFGKAFLRWIGLSISFLVCFVGVIWVAFDARKQAGRQDRGTVRAQE